MYSSLARNPDIPASAMDRASLQLRSMPDTFSVSYHHAAGTLGYRGRGLVVVVVSDLDDPGVDSPALGVQALAPVAVIALAVVVPGSGDGLVRLVQPPDRGIQRLRILHLQSVGAHGLDSERRRLSIGSTL